MADGWQIIPDPKPGSKIESWSRTNEEGGSAWIQNIGTVELDGDGDLFFPFAELEHQQFHAQPPTKEAMFRVWRYV